LRRHLNDTPKLVKWNLSLLLVFVLPVRL